MHPILFELPIFGGLKIYSYGVLVATAFIVGILWTLREARRTGISKDRVLDLSFYIILAALIGSRILYVIVDWRRYASNPLDILKIWEGGLIFYGGLLASFVTSLFYLKRHSLSFFQTADLFMPGVALGHSIGRLGCLFAGCCHGHEVHGISWAITFPDIPESLAPPGIPLYPSQILESAAAFLTFLLLILVRKRARLEGQVFFAYLAFYGLLRIPLESFRGDAAKSFIIPHWITTSQFISLLLILTSVFLFWWKRERDKIP